jgi:hypothetical protein
MKNYFKKLALLVALTLLIITSCSKSDSPDQNGNLQEENLLDPVDDELNAMLAAIPSDTQIQAEDLKFDDGSSILDFAQQYDPNFLNEHIANRTMAPQTITPEFQKKLFIERMTVMAHSLVLKSNWINYKNSNQPNGLAYNWGSKKHLELKIPAMYNKKLNICQEPLYGLDCSGMIYQMGLAAGIDLANGGCNAEFERNEKNWNDKFIASTEFKDLKAKLYKHSGVSIADPSYIDIFDLKEGDLIFKTALDENNKVVAIHVGMILRTEDDILSIYQSNGNPKLGCEANKSDTRGPRVLSLFSSEAFGQGKLFGVDWQVIRFETNGANFSANLNGALWQPSQVIASHHLGGIYISAVSDYYILNFQVPATTGTYINQVTTLSYPEVSELGNGNIWVSNYVKVTEVNDNFIKGTFNATFQLEAGGTVNFTGGQFEVPIQ